MNTLGSWSAFGGGMIALLLIAGQVEAADPVDTQLPADTGTGETLQQQNMQQNRYRYQQELGAQDGQGAQNQVRQQNQRQQQNQMQNRQRIQQQMPAAGMGSGKRPGGGGGGRR